MSDIQLSTITGNLGRDPALRYTQNQMAVLEFSVGCDNKGRDGEKTTTWYKIVLFGKRAEQASKMLEKGVKVLVHGRYEFETWEKDGQPRYGHKILADGWQMLAGSGGDRQAGSRQGRGAVGEHAEPYAPDVRGDGYQDDEIPF